MVMTRLRSRPLAWLLMLVMCGGILVPGGRAVAAPAVQPPLATFEPASCDFIDPIIGVVPPDVECGYVIVPEEYSNPSGPTIRLAVAIVPSQAPNPAPDPLVMLQGGPGGSTIDTYIYQLVVNGELPFNRDVILFNQRGTRYSEPNLDCPEVLETTIENIDRILPDEEEEQIYTAALKSCRNRLVNEGVNLSAFDSIENAADVDAVREALGYEQINLYGVSYGTTLALHTMRNHPEGLRTVILDAVAPPSINFLTEVPASQDRAFTTLFTACANDSGCAAAFPNLEERFFALIDRLNANPVEIRLTDMETGTTYDAILDGDSTFEAIFLMLYATDILPLIPQIIHETDRGYYKPLSSILSSIIFDRTVSQGMYFSVVCAEDADFTVADLDLTGVRPEIAESGEADAASLLQSCALWDIETLGPAVDAPVASSIPTLILSGNFDPITPAAFAEAAAANLPQSYNYVFPNTGHSAAFNGDCPDQIIRDFLDSPNVAPDADCIENLSAPNFITPTDILTLPALLRLANLEDNSGTELTLFGLGLFVLLSVILIWPIIWLVRRIQQRPSKPRPILLHLAPWVAGINGSLILSFAVILFGLIISLGIEGSNILLLGVPASWGPLFVLPLISTLLTLTMLASSGIAWFGDFWSIVQRIYFSLVTLAALLCTILLIAWGMVGAVYF